MKRTSARGTTKLMVLDVRGDGAGGGGCRGRRCWRYSSSQRLQHRTRRDDNDGQQKKGLNLLFVFASADIVLVG